MKDKTEIAALAEAMNNLAAAINRACDEAATLRSENPELNNLPQALLELNRRLTTLCTRL